jgi:hypothetical protein
MFLPLTLAARSAVGAVEADLQPDASVINKINPLVSADKVARFIAGDCTTGNEIAIPVLYFCLINIRRSASWHVVKSVIRALFTATESATPITGRTAVGIPTFSEYAWLLGKPHNGCVFAPVAFVQAESRRADSPASISNLPKGLLGASKDI